MEFYNAEEIQLVNGKSFSSPVYAFENDRGKDLAVIILVGNMRYEVPYSSILYIRDMMKAENEGATPEKAGML